VESVKGWRDARCPIPIFHFLISFFLLLPCTRFIYYTLFLPFYCPSSPSTSLCFSVFYPFSFAIQSIFVSTSSMKRLAFKQIWKWGSDVTVITVVGLVFLYFISAAPRPAHAQHAIPHPIIPSSFSLRLSFHRVSNPQRSFIHTHMHVSLH